MEKAEIAIIGGSGFYEFLEKAHEIEINTDFGQPSDKITIGELSGKKVAFLPRHGQKHQFSPHQVPYRANIQALKDLGVKSIIAPAAVGSLKPEIKRGNFVICDQFIDRTRKREDTFYDEKKTVHITSHDAYCPTLRKLAYQSSQKLDILSLEKGTVVVIEGPRFSSIAESRWFSNQGWDVINMTQYPEVILAHEREICYVNISLVTDFDFGLDGVKGIKSATIGEILNVFKENNQKVKKVIFEMIENWPQKFECGCRQALSKAEV